MATQCKANTFSLLSVILPLLLCGVLSKEAEAAAAGSEGGCPFIIGVASTEGRPDIFKSYIGGQWRTSSSGRTLKVLSPVNETTLFEVQVETIFCPICTMWLRCWRAACSARYTAKCARERYLRQDATRAFVQQHERR